MVVLSPELAEAVAAAKGQCLRLRDPNTNKDYVLLGADVFERMRRFLVEDEAELDMRQVGQLIHEAMREEDENDPLLESYQNYQRAK